MEDLEKELSESSDLHENEGSVTQNKRSVWPWILGAAGGAVVVGAIWAISSTSGGPVIAKVGNTAIHQSQFYSKMESLSGSQTLQGMITDTLITNAAKKYNVTASQTEINTALSNMEAQYGISSPDQLSMFLAQNGVTMADLNGILKNQVLEQKLATRNVTASEAEITAYYNANKTQFVKPGSKNPQPLSAVHKQVEMAVKQSKAPQPSQLLANLAKEDGITIMNSKYANVKNQLENPTTSSAPGGQ